MRSSFLLLLSSLALARGSEILDPPLIDGWSGSHRLYHGIAGALIAVGIQEAVHLAAPRWARAHPVLTQVIAGLVTGTAAVGKEWVDHRHGSETNQHSAGDIAVTTGAGVAVGYAWSYRW